MPAPPPASLADLVLLLAEQGTADAPDGPVYVEVLRYYPDEQVADVRLAVVPASVDPDSGDVVGETPPILPRCPVLWPRGAGVAVVWGLEPGDLALGVVRSRSHDEVDSGSAIPATPASARRSNLADLVVVPMVGGGAAPLTSAAYRSDGQPVITLAGAGDAVHVGSSTAALQLVIAEVLRPYLVDLRDWLIGLTLPVSGSTAGPPNPLNPPPVVPAAANLASGRIKVDT